jgi:hypothetical protein
MEGFGVGPFSDFRNIKTASTGSTVVKFQSLLQDLGFVVSPI